MVIFSCVLLPETDPWSDLVCRLWSGHPYVPANSGLEQTTVTSSMQGQLFVGGPIAADLLVLMIHECGQLSLACSAQSTAQGPL